MSWSVVGLRLGRVARTLSGRRSGRGRAARLPSSNWRNRRTALVEVHAAYVDRSRRERTGAPGRPRVMHAALMGSTHSRVSKRSRALPAALLALLALPATAGAVTPPPPPAGCPQTGVSGERRVCSAVELDAVLRSPDF